LKYFSRHVKDALGLFLLLAVSEGKFRFVNGRVLRTQGKWN